jgi:tRNA (guanine-N7-)-methyltransferase
LPIYKKIDSLKAMARTKLIKFKEIEQSKIVIEQSKDIFTKIKGEWGDFFGNKNPIILELGCGNGEYTNNLAILNPNQNYVGIDIKGERIGTAARFASEKRLSNVAFLRTQIQLLKLFFKQGEVSEIWITFPDPQPNNTKKRLTSERFLKLYSHILIDGGIINLKTDSEILFDYTLELLQKNSCKDFQIQDLIYTRDLYDSEHLELHQGIQTRFEKVYLAKGEKIKYLRFGMTKK